MISRGSIAGPGHYASQWESPPPTQDSLPAAGQALQGGIRSPAGFRRKDSEFEALPPLPGSWRNVIYIAPGKLRKGGRDSKLGNPSSEPCG